MNEVRLSGEFSIGGCLVEKFQIGKRFIEKYMVRNV